MEITFKLEATNPTSIAYLSTEDLQSISKKMQALVNNMYYITFTKNIYNSNNMLIGCEKFELADLRANPIGIIVDLDMAYDEFYIEFDEPIETIMGGTIQNKGYLLGLEIVTKEVAESNDKEFLGADFTDSYEVGTNNSYYLPIPNTEYFYREL